MQDAAPDVAADAASDGEPADGTPTEVGTDADAADAADDGGQTYDGPTGGVQGTLFVSSPPAFPTVRQDEYPLSFPANIGVWAFGQEYTSTYDPAAGYVVDMVPVGTWTFVVRDIDGKNGLLDSALERNVEEALVAWDVPVFGKNSFVVIYGSVSPPVIRDPALAQVVLSFEACEKDGGGRLAGVVVAHPAGGKVLVHDGVGWKLDDGGGTGEHGVVILPNLQAEPYPGGEVSVSYVLGGSTFPVPPFTVFRGGVTRVVVVHLC
jgi:hypothetical protein